MEKFNYYIDEKVTIWRRSFVEIKAETKEEADKKAKEIMLDEGFDGDNNELLYETECTLSVEDNDGSATIELFDSSGCMITDNKPLDIKRDDKINEILE